MAGLRRQYGFIPIGPIAQKYTDLEWTQREEQYKNSVSSIVLPFEPDDVDINAINAMIDQVYTIAKIEYAIYDRLFEKLTRQKKNSETEVYLIIKRGLPVDANGNPEKRTETEMKALGANFLLNHIVDGTSYTIYQLLDMAETRKVFMEAIIDILNKKSDKLITDSGALKLAVQLSGRGGGNTP